MTDAQIADVRAIMGAFSPDRPLVVNARLFAELKAEPRLADLMSRVFEQRPIPLHQRRP